MKLLVVVLVSLMTIQVVADDDSSCIKPAQDLPIDAKSFDCRKDSDCELVDEACRSCQEPLALNSAYITAFNETDESDRVDTMCLLTCEACDQSQAKVSCKAGKCIAEIDSNKAAPQVPQVEAPQKAEPPPRIEQPAAPTAKVVPAVITPKKPAKSATKTKKKKSISSP